MDFIIKLTGIMIFSMAIAFLAGSFFNADIDIMLWSKISRLIVVIFAIALTGFLYNKIESEEYYDDEDENEEEED